MGLYGSPRDEREELKSEIQKLMNDYAEEIIDGDTYQKKMMDLTLSKISITSRKNNILDNSCFGGECFWLRRL